MEFPPPKLVHYVPGTTKVDAVEQDLKDWEQILKIVKDHLIMARQRRKNNADLHRTIGSTKLVTGYISNCSLISNTVQPFAAH